MNMIKHAAESAENSPSIGRIAPLNMASETKGLNYDSLIRDMTTANEYDGDEGAPRGDLWACAAIRG